MRFILMLAALIASYGCAARTAAAPDGLLETYAAKARELGVRARPVASALTTSIEANDQVLASRLLQVKALPTPLLHRQVAERYRELKILDAAHGHFSRALQLDPTDAAAYDGRARIWRDWGFPHLGLDDALRTVSYAPSWPAAHNTLGTLLAALGRWADARRAYERALVLDGRAAYALNNLCYLSFLEGQIARALGECRAALDVEPDLTAARNNLGLAYAAAQRDDLAQREFLAAADEAAGLFNVGIIHLASKRYVSASQAFDAASRQRPSFAAARARARQSRVLAATTADLPQ